MNQAQVLKRIEQRLQALDLTANAASLLSGKKDAVRNLRRAVRDGGRQGITLATLAALAPVLRTTMAWLADEAGPEDPSIDQQTIPVWGQAGAGGKIYHFHEATEIDRIPAPENSNRKTGAVEIIGDSLGTLFDRWFAIYDEVRDPPTSDLYGKLCILETSDGLIYIKRLKKGRGKKFILESNYEPPIYDVTVVWAARVRTLVPR